MSGTKEDMLEMEIYELRMNHAHEEALRLEADEALNETEVQLIAVRAQRDAAQNRIKYLESLITTAAKLAGVVL